MKQYKKVFLAICLLMFSLVSMGASYVWTPTVPVSPNRYDWSNANNWRVGGVVSGTPGVADAVSILTVSNVQKINLPSTAFTVASLTMSTTGVGEINFSASAAVTITTTGLLNMTSTSIGSTTTTSFPGFGSDQFITYNVSTVPPTTVMTISNTKINYALKTNSANVAVTGSTFFGAYEMVATPTSDSYCGGNTFAPLANFIVENKSTFKLVMGNTSFDTYNGTVAIKRTGTGDIHMSYNSTGNIYAQPVTLYSTAAGGIYFGGANGTSSFNGISCLISSAGSMTAGGLNIKNITKTSTVASSIVVGGAGVTIGPSMTIKGNLTVVAEYVNMNGGANPGVVTSNKFENDVDLTYTGIGSYTSLGGNLFMEKLKITNDNTNPANSTIGFGSTYNDEVDGDLTVVNKVALRTILLGTVKNFDLRGNVYVNNTNTGAIQFGDRANTGVFVFAKDKKTFIGTDGGVTNGYINFNSVNQAMPTDPSSTGFLFDLKIPNGTCATIVTGDLTIFRSRVEFEAPEILILGGQFYNHTTLTVLDGCTVARTTPALPTLGSYIARHSHFYMSLTCNVKNTLQVNPVPAFFISADAVNTNETVLVDGDLILEQLTINSRPITVCTNATVKITVAGKLKVRHGGGNNHITVAANGQATVNGDIELSKGIADPIGIGLIKLGSEVTTSLFTHQGSNVGIESEKTFLGGGVSFNYFKQINSSGQISLPRTTSPTVIDIASVHLGYNSDFKSLVSVKATTVTIYQANFLQNVVLESWSTGSNIKGTVNFGTVVAGNPATPADLTFTHNAPGVVFLITNLAVASNVSFYGNVVLNATNATGVINSGSNVSVANIYKDLTYTNTFNTTAPIFSGTTNFLTSADGPYIKQYVNYSSASITFQHISINKTYFGVYMQKDMVITGNANFIKGLIFIPAANVATFNSGSAVQSQGPGSFINGKVQKIGNTAFAFPVGDGYYGPISISAPCNAAAAITIQYINNSTTHPNSSTLTALVPDYVTSGYWNVTCPNTYSCSIAVTLHWTPANTQNINKSVMTVAKCISPNWSDAGRVSTTGDGMTGSVTAATSTAFVGSYVLGYKTLVYVTVFDAYPALFKLGANIDLAKNNSAYPPVEATSMSYIPYSIHPSMNTTCAQIDVLQDPPPGYPNFTSTAMSLCLVTDANGHIIQIRTAAGQDLSTDYYTYNPTTRYLYIYGNKKPDGKISIINNLSYGTIWRKLSTPTLSFTINGNRFAYAHLKVTDLTGAIKFDQDVTFTSGNSLDWTGSTITTDGLYIYQLSLGNTAGGGGAITYTGNMSVKVAE